MIKNLIIIVLSLALAYSLPQIYGVRWYLGDGFQFKLPTDPNYSKGTKYILAFNSQQQIDVPITLIIDEGEYTCSSRHLELKNKVITVQNLSQHKSYQTNSTFQTYIHLCYIDYELEGNLPYSIITLDTQYEAYQNKTYLLGREEITFFKGVFRALTKNSNYKLLVVGDWGYFNKTTQEQKGYTPIIGCLKNHLQSQDDIRGMLFMGDIAYNFQGSLSVNMLKYIQPLTSQIVWVMTPGNHDTVYYDAGFVLFTESIRNPLWSKYHNYFVSAQLGLNLTDVQIYESFKSIQNELTNNVTAFLAVNRTVIVMSHYPVYCSDPNDDLQACQKNSQKLQYYRKYFNDMKMDLYISGHLHVYERLQPICYQQITDNNKLKYGKQYEGLCPVYIIEGSGGSQYYLQTNQKEYQKQKYSAQIVVNTGYGLITVTKDSVQPMPNLKYQHFVGKQCKKRDQVIVNNSINPEKSNYLKISLVILGVLLIIAGAVAVVGFYLGKCRKMLKKQSIEMVQEVNSEKQPKNQFPLQA